MDSLCAIYIIAFVGGFNWRLGLWRPPPKLINFAALSGIEAGIARKARKKRMNRNRLIWLFVSVIRFCVILIFTVLIMNHLRVGLIQITTWDDLAVKGTPYILTLWFLFSITSGLIRRFRQPHDKEDSLNRMWWFAFSAIFVAWVVYLLIRGFGL